MLKKKINWLISLAGNTLKDYYVSMPFEDILEIKKELSPDATFIKNLGNISRLCIDIKMLDKKKDGFINLFPTDSLRTYSDIIGVKALAVSRMYRHGPYDEILEAARILQYNGEEVVITIDNPEFGGAEPLGDVEAMKIVNSIPAQVSWVEMSPELLERLISRMEQPIVTRPMVLGNVYYYLNWRTGEKTLPILVRPVIDRKLYFQYVYTEYDAYNQIIKFSASAPMSCDP